MEKNNYFGHGIEELIEKNNKWDWDNFKSTANYPIPSRTLLWVIGQDNVLRECNISLREWVEKIKWLESSGHFSHLKLNNILKILKHGFVDKKILEKRIPAGPFLLLLGDPGTGKSLLGQALADVLTSLYKENNIPMDNILVVKNARIPSNPKIAILPVKTCYPTVQKIEKKAGLRGKIFNRLLKGLVLFLAAIGVTLLSISVGYIIMFMMRGMPFATAFLNMGSSLIAGGTLTLFSIMGYYFGRMMTGGYSGTNIGNIQQGGSIKVIVDNTLEKAPFVDGTGARPSSLFGDIAWDPYQTGGLGTSEHQRVTAGLVHQAHKGVLYIDEIKNLQGESVIDLLTALEDGQFAITLRGRDDQSGSAAMNVKTDPAPCMFFFVGAGNLDSVPLLHPALKDRFYGYGKIILMNNEMRNTIENRRKYVQFISQEIKRFNLLPFTKNACIEVIEEARRRTDRRGYLTCKFRPLIGVIKTASTLATIEGIGEVQPKHVKEAIEEHCKTIEAQVLGKFIEEEKQILEVQTEGSELGRVNGLTVIEDPYSKERVGNVSVVKASMIKVKRNRGSINKEGSFTVTGIPGKMLKESCKKVRQVILKKYGIDIAQDYITHVDFVQSYGVDGPSAGVTMAVAIASLLEGKPVKQEIAITGEINISELDQVPITAVGGLYEKLKAAERWGIKKCLIPLRNYEHSIDTKDYKIEVIGLSTLDEYLERILVGRKDAE